jgi:hypothetical protein
MNSFDEEQLEAQIAMMKSLPGRLKAVVPKEKNFMVRCMGLPADNQGQNSPMQPQHGQHQHTNPMQGCCPHTVALLLH